MFGLGPVNDNGIRVRLCPKGRTCTESEVKVLMQGSAGSAKLGYHTLPRLEQREPIYQCNTVSRIR